MNMMILSNPRLAALITMASILVLGTIIAYWLFRLSYQRILRKKINSLTNAALTARDETIAILEAELIHKDEIIAHQKAKLSTVAVFLGRAVSAAGVNEESLG